MSNELLPCPFCGHDEPTHDEGDQSAWVQCTNFECGMCGPIASGPSLAAAAWNRRATQPAAGEPVEAKEIGEMTITLRDGVKCFSFEEYSEAYKLPEGLHYLYAAPPAAAHGDEAVRKMVMPERIDRSQYLSVRGDAVAQGWNDCLNWIDKANAMRAQGDGGEA